MVGVLPLPKFGCTSWQSALGHLVTSERTSDRICEHLRWWHVCLVPLCVERACVCCVHVLTLKRMCAVISKRVNCARRMEFGQPVTTLPGGGPHVEVSSRGHEHGVIFRVRVVVATGNGAHINFKMKILMSTSHRSCLFIFSFHLHSPSLCRSESQERERSPKSSPEQPLQLH